MDGAGKSSASPVLYFPHGGGPMPLLGDPAHQSMVDFLSRFTSTLPIPSAILVVSAHWEAQVPTVTGGLSPSLIYDYHGFPEEAYRIQYPAPGSPPLARKILTMLSDAGMDARLDDQRGFDHGLFVPLKLMYPDAGVPCVQVSLISGLDPDEHMRMGRALAGLRKENVLILGSGFSFHNMRAFFSAESGVPDTRNDAFQQWLIETCTTGDRPHQSREDALRSWEAAPFARYCHPREEHLAPLFVCFGAGLSAARLVFDQEVLGKRSVALLW